MIDKPLVIGFIVNSMVLALLVGETVTNALLIGASMALVVLMGLELNAMAGETDDADGGH